MTGQESRRKVLFLCTGNYFRSRLAEELFNHWARRLRLDWYADSRALARNLDDLNLGEISAHTLHALALRGIAPRTAQRFPIAAEVEDFAQSDLVVAVKGTEHRPMMEAHFPGYADQIEYWEVHDLDVAPPSTGVTQVEQALLALLRRLRGA